MVAQVPGQAEGLSAQVAHVSLLTVDSHVVAQGHVVGVRFAAEVAPEFGDESKSEVRDGRRRRIYHIKTDRVLNPYLKSPILWVSLWLSSELACL